MPGRNREGAPYWGTLTEVAVIRHDIRMGCPEVSDAELDELTFDELIEARQRGWPAWRAARGADR